MVTKNKSALRSRIITIVNSSQGLKGVELSTRLAGEFLEFTGEEILHEIFDLIENGQLVEIEYELPTMMYRTKSFILPKGTAININKR